jgi:hypothetical protein
MGIIGVNKLTPAGYTDVILLTFPLAIFTDVSGSTFRTLHRRLP